MVNEGYEVVNNICSAINSLALCCNSQQFASYGFEGTLENMVGHITTLYGGQLPHPMAVAVNQLVRKPGYESLNNCVAVNGRLQQAAELLSKDIDDDQRQVINLWLAGPDLLQEAINGAKKS